VVGGKLTLGALAGDVRDGRPQVPGRDRQGEPEGGPDDPPVRRRLPSASTFTDNAVLALNAADLAKVVAKINVAAADYETLDSKAVACLDLSLVVRSVQAARNLYMPWSSRPGPRTYTRVTDLKLRFGFLND
jgi:hypothetical protein